MKMGRTFYAMVCALALTTMAMLPGGAAAQEKGPPQIAMVDVGHLLQNIEAAKSLKVQIEKKRAEILKDIAAWLTERDKLERELAQARPGMSSRAYYQRLRELRQRDAGRQNDAEEIENQLGTAFQRATEEMAKAVEQVVDEIMAERNYSVVMPRASVVGTRGVPDITQEALQRLNKRMPSVSIDLKNER